MIKGVQGLCVSLFVCLLALSLGACGPSQLRSSDFPTEDGGFKISDDASIVDNKDNRDILELFLAYRNAMVERDPDRLRPLVSRGYFENGSTTSDHKDDYGPEKLEDIYAELTDTVQEARYDIKIWRILREANIAHVDYEYVGSFRFRTGGKERWESLRDVNRITLVRENDQWKIAGGM